jgi:hypothetical protein
MAAEAPLDDFGQVVEAGRLARLAARIMAAAAAGLLALLAGPFHALGAVMGGLVVEANLDLFLAFARGAVPGRLSVPLWVAVLKFNVAFVLTLAVCVLIVKFRIGHPLAFLLGLSVFIPAVIAGILLYWRKRSAGAPPPALGPAKASGAASGAARPPDPVPAPDSVPDRDPAAPPAGGGHGA